jgi:hypothetical protein
MISFNGGKMQLQRLITLTIRVTLSNFPNCYFRQNNLIYLLPIKQNPTLQVLYKSKHKKMVVQDKKLRGI